MFAARIARRSSDGNDKPLPTIVASATSTIRPIESFSSISSGISPSTMPCTRHGANE